MSRPIVAALGDSLTAGEHVDGTPLHIHPWVAFLDANLFPDVSFANFGVGGERVDQMLTRYNSYINGLGFDALILWGGINDILQDRLAPAIWANMQTIINAAIADGMRVVLIHTPGFGTMTGWTVGRQAQFDALRALMVTRTDVTHIDLYQPAPAGLNDPNDTDALLVLYATSDRLHVNLTGVAHMLEIFEPVFRTLYPEPVVVETVQTGVVVFGVTASSVRKHHFPNAADFSDSSNPTSATVTEKIEDAAGELAGRLLKEAIDPATIDAQGGTYAPYVILRKTLRKMVALEIAPAMNEDSKRIDRWAKELKDFFVQLEEDSATALGDASLETSASDPSGPTDHIDEYGLDIGDPGTEASDVIPPFRKSDEM